MVLERKQGVPWAPLGFQGPMYDTGAQVLNALTFGISANNTAAQNATRLQAAIDTGQHVYVPRWDDGSAYPMGAWGASTAYQQIQFGAGAVLNQQDTIEFTNQHGIVRGLRINTSAAVSKLVSVNTSFLRMYDPEIIASGATFGLYFENAADISTSGGYICRVFGGRIKGNNAATKTAGSVGLYIGDRAHELTVVGLTVDHWETGCVMRACDTPTIIGSDFENCTGGYIVIDANNGGFSDHIKGLTLQGVFFEQTASAPLIVIDHRTGSIRGGSVRGCFMGNRGGVGSRVFKTNGTVKALVFEGNYSSQAEYIYEVLSSGADGIVDDPNFWDGYTGFTTGAEAGRVAYRRTIFGGRVMDLGPNLRIAGGSNISGHLSTQAVLDFPSVSAGSFQSLTATLTGAVTTDAVQVTPIGSIENGITYHAYCSVADQVTVVARNHTSAAIDPANRNYRLTIWRR